MIIWVSYRRILSGSGYGPLRPEYQAYHEQLNTVYLANRLALHPASAQRSAPGDCDLRPEYMRLLQNHWSDEREPPYEAQSSAF